VGRGILAAGIAVTALTGCAPRAVPAEAPTGGAPDALHSRQASFLAALAERDVHRTMDHIADDAVLHIANMPAVRGRAAIAGFYGGIFRAMSATRPTIEQTRVSAAGDLAYSTGRVINTFLGPDGPVEYEGKFFLAWEYRDGRWLVTVYGVTGDRAQPGR
jgi:ketosteroid isomerase-like protein